MFHHDIKERQRRIRTSGRLERPDSSVIFFIPLFPRAFSNSRACAKSVFDRYCTISVPVPTQNHLNPFCHDRDFNQSKEPKVDFQASKRSINETETASQPNQPVPNRAHKTSRALSRMLSVAVSVVNLTTAAWKLGLN